MLIHVGRRRSMLLATMMMPLLSFRTIRVETSTEASLHLREIINKINKISYELSLDPHPSMKPITDAVVGALIAILTIAVPMITIVETHGVTYDSHKRIS